MTDLERVREVVGYQGGMHDDAATELDAHLKEDAEREANAPWKASYMAQKAELVNEKNIRKEWQDRYLALYDEAKAVADQAEGDQAENARLREALEKIAALAYEDAPADYYDIARNALKEPND